MLKGAIYIFAFSIFLFGCATKITYRPLPDTSSPQVPPAPLPSQPVFLPDIALTDLFLSEMGRVVITLTNGGKAIAPHGAGHLMIYVGGDLRWSISLGELPDQAFLEPGGKITYITPVELVGMHEVKAVIDLKNERIDENESNNILVKVLGRERSALLPPPSAPLPPLPGPDKSKEAALRPDITITNISLNPQRRLVITLRNKGEGAFRMGSGSLRILVDGRQKGNFPLTGFSDQSFLRPQRSINLTTSITIIGRHEVQAHVDTDLETIESDKENNAFKRILRGLPVGPDIVVKDLDLTEDFELSIILSNAGDGDLRKGATVRIRILVNDQKISEFDHYTSDALKTNFGNQYAVSPPYRIEIGGNSKVKVSIWPTLSSDDVYLENNTVERNFVIYPFRIGPQEKQEFSLSLSAIRLREGRQAEKLKVEVRWEGGGSPLRFSFKGPKHGKSPSSISGKSPLKMEVPISYEQVQKGEVWKASVANLMEKKAEGHLIIQHP